MSTPTRTPTRPMRRPTTGKENSFHATRCRAHEAGPRDRATPQLPKGAFQMSRIFSARLQRLSVPLIVAVLAFAGGSMYVARGADAPVTFTGCLNSKVGVLYNVVT